MINSRIKIPQLLLASAAILFALHGCAAGQAPSMEKLDEVTAVTYTYSRSPLILSPDIPLDRGTTRDYVQIGPIEVNRMGSLSYYLWLGISDIDNLESAAADHAGFETVFLVLGDQKIELKVLGWTHSAIGVSEPVYKKLFSSSVDAYYEVTLEQIQRMSEVDSVKVLATGADPKEFVSWYRQTTAKQDLAAFLMRVAE